MKETENYRRIRHEQWALELETVLPKSATRFTANLIESRWGKDVAPMTTQLAYLQYDFRGYPTIGVVHHGRLGRTQSLLHAAMTNQQTVGAGRFGESVFGLYTPPPVGPRVELVDIDETSFPGGGFADYEGIYRQTIPQRYGPDTQLTLSPSAFKRWVWTLELKNKYSAYVKQAWPDDADVRSASPYPLKTAVKSAFVMAAYLQNQEQSLSGEGLKLALRGAGLAAEQPWETLTSDKLQGRFVASKDIEFSRLRVYRYCSTDIWCFAQPGHDRRLLYIPGNSSPFHEFIDIAALRRWVVDVGRNIERAHALAAHFLEEDRNDGVFHAGVITALQGMAVYPRQHLLTASAGFFNNDGYWPPVDYSGLDSQPADADPFGLMVLAMKQAALSSIETIRDDAQVNRQQLSAVVEPVVQWLDRYGPLALLIPGGEGVLALAGLIDAGYGLAEAVDANSSAERSEGITRTVFGLLNALPVLAEQLIKPAEQKAVNGSLREQRRAPLPVKASMPAVAIPIAERVALMRDIGSTVERFSDEVLLQIQHVSGLSNDTLRAMSREGRASTPVLQDTISRFAIDQDLQQGIDAAPPHAALAEQLVSTRGEQFIQRYEVLQQSIHEWIKLFRRQFPRLPKSAVEQMLDRAGVDINAAHSLGESKRIFSQLSGKAQQYEQHVRACRAYEGFYLKSSMGSDNDVLLLHTLERLPGWSPQWRVEVLNGATGSQMVDSVGPIGAPIKTQVVKTSDGLFDQALFDVLTSEQRAALGLQQGNELADFQAKIRANALSHAELSLGLSRMDSGLRFQFSGLRGGGFPNTAQGAEFSWQVMRLQVKQIYPAITDAQADEFLRNLGSRAQTELDRLRLQMEQLGADISEWIEDIHFDINDMSVELLPEAEGLAGGMTVEEIEDLNDARIEARMEEERTIRYELAEELIALWQGRGGSESRVYENGRFVGFHLDMDFDPMYSLPQLNIKFHDVISLSMPDFRVSQRGSINGFLECFPNLRWLGMKGVDLRLFNTLGQEVGTLPPAISLMSQLEILNLNSTGLVLTEQTSGQIARLQRLRIIDLGNNPLGVAPVVLNMPELRELKLRAASLTSSPIGIFERPYLQRLDLRDNQLSRIPEAVRRQSVAQGNVLLSGNPITDPSSLQWIVEHRQQTGINVWLARQTHTVFLPESWTTGLPAERAAHLSACWERIAVKAGGDRFFGTLELMTRTADFVVDYSALQSRVWHMIEEMDASPELCRYLFEEVQSSALDSHDPFTSFTRLEEHISTFIESSAKRPRLEGGPQS